jgi:Predicted nucleotide-binding protein containing TIR-like domain
MIVPVLAHPECKSLAATEEAIRVVNQLQPYFRLRLEKAKWLLNGTKSKVDPEVITNLVRKKYVRQRVLVVVQTPMKGGFFDYPSKGVCVVSTAEWEEQFAPPPTMVFLVFLFACSLASLVADLPDEQIENLRHKKCRGCVFDDSSGRREMRLGLVAAHLCAQCEGCLAEWGVSDKPIDALVELLAYVRAFAIRRPRSTPSYVFIGHGRYGDWKKLADFLVTNGLRVDEFNTDPTAGLTNVERLTDMLNRACFALLVMTAEDEHGDGKNHARENVVHEIGLFQGRIGFKKSIIVMQNGVSTFSNIDGLTYIPYPRGKIEKAFPLITAALAREGILDSPMAGSVSKKRGITGQKAP